MDRQRNAWCGKQLCIWLQQPSACNFNANAILGDESQCTFDCAGCTYPNADNFTVGQRKTMVRVSSRWPTTAQPT